MIASIITALFLLGYMSATTASNFLFISGALLIAGEIGFGTFWLIGFNGVLALVMGYVIRTGDTMLLGVPLDWGVVFGIAAVEAALLLGSMYVILKYRGKKATTGTESMIGHKATVIEWSGKSGKVSVQGETWKAKSDHALELAKDENVKISAVEGLIVKITV